MPEGTMAKVRNPLAGFGITIASALGFSFFMCVPILFLPQAELVYFYLPFALFGVGAFSGRSGFLGTLGFIGATMGAFLGVYAFQSVLDRKSTRLNSSHEWISYAVFCLKKK